MLTYRFAAHAAQSFAIPSALASAIAFSRYGFRSLWHLIQTRAFVLLWMTRIRLPICTSTVVTPSRLRRNRVDPPAWMLPAHSIAPLARGPLANPRGIQNNRTEGQLSMNEGEEISDKERQPAVASRVVRGYGHRGFSMGGVTVDLSADEEAGAVSFESPPTGRATGDRGALAGIRGNADKV